MKEQLELDGRKNIQSFKICVFAVKDCLSQSILDELSDCVIFNVLRLKRSSQLSSNPEFKVELNQWNSRNETCREKNKIPIDLNCVSSLYSYTLGIITPSYFLDFF